jgi:hypothetical protein
MQLALLGTSALLRITPTTTANLDWHIDYVDGATSAGALTNVFSPNSVNGQYATAAITTILAGTVNNVRNVKLLTIRNTDASTANTVTVSHNDATTLVTLIKVTLQPGDTLEFNESYGFFVVSSNTTVAHNQSTSSQTGFAADTYLTGSSLTLPASLPIVGTTYRLWFDVTKTVAGIVAIVINIRFGINGSTADSSVCAFTFGTATAAIDAGVFTIQAMFRTVGSGTSAVVQGWAELGNNLTSTGLTSLAKNVVTTGGGFNSTTANPIIGTSYNGGASAAHTIQMVRAELIA